MTPDRWRKVEELYHAARERDVTLRAVYLHEACAGDDGLRQEVESRLAQDAQAGSFLEASLVRDVAAQAAHEAKLFENDPAQSQDAAPDPSQEQSLVGRQLGSYLVRAKIGAGGMGEVYRAFDTKLRRDVALKVLPKPFARDPERLARFRREAQLLASLNHKNIAAIHGFEETPEANFLVLELVEGETFAERIQRQGPLPVKDALTLAGQVAEGLEAAHRKGITHRDIKPANIKVTPEGEVKVLDFGLAKAFAGDRANADLSELPTLEPGPTKDGQILGTPAYMSPEQVRGQEVDKRTDIWAFGCVLYELLTGQRVFQSRDPSRARLSRAQSRDQQAASPSRERERPVVPSPLADIISAVLNNEPDWTALPAETPATIRTLLRRCLQKDANLRLHDIADARIEITEALSAPAAVETTVTALPARPTRNVWRWALVSGVACLLVGALAAGIAIWNLRTLPPQPTTRSAIILPPGVALADLEVPVLAISPDGSHLAYVGSRGGTQQIFLRALDSLEDKPIEGTEGANTPFFSPDGQWIGFFVGTTLKKISIAGGASVTLDTPSNTAGIPSGASWGDNDTIAFTAAAAFGLFQVSAVGGTPQPLTKIDPAKDERTHRWPQLLPGGRAVLFTVQSPEGVGNFDEAVIAVHQLETGERKVLVQGGTYARLVPTGHLVYLRGGTLMAAPFDLRRLELIGPAVPVVEGVRQSAAIGSGQFSISDQGSLVYITGGVRRAENSLVWVDRKGVEQPLELPPRAYSIPRLSPDGRLLAVDSQRDIWVYDIPPGTLSRLTFEGTSNRPLWSPNGQVIAFAEADPTTGFDLWVLPLSGDPSSRGAGSGQGRQPQSFLRIPRMQAGPKFSPDGRWIAYISNESGRFEVYVQPFPGPGGKWQVSTDGGIDPIWSRNGELFYRNGNRMMVVATQTEPTFSAGTPRMLFEGNYQRSPSGNANYDVTADGQRFVMVKPPEPEPAPTQINVVLNWFEELQRRVPAGQ